ncbi:MAG: MFS transporter [Chloroflexota bacterium]
MPTSTPSPTRPISYIALIRGNSNFRYLWFGQIVSLLGDWFNLIASAALISTLTGSGLAVGALFVIRSLAPFLVSPFAGVAADRLDRKWILIATDILRGLLMLGFLFVRDADDVWILYTLTALQFAVSGFFFPTRNAILPDLVDQDSIGTANALSSATWSIMLSLGTAIGGLVAGWLGVYTAFVLDAFTFLISAILLLQIRYQRHAREEDSKSMGDVLNTYVEGLRFLVEHRPILFIAIQKAFIALLMFNPGQVISVALAEQTFVYGKDGSLGLGLMFTVVGIGTGLGPILIRRFTGDQDFPLRRAISITYLIAIVGLIITAPLFNFGSYLLGNFIRGIGSGTIWVFTTQLLMQNVPSHMRGRIFATEFALFTLTSAIGAGLAGLAIDWTDSFSWILWGIVFLAMIPALLWIVNTRRLKLAIS